MLECKEVKEIISSYMKYHNYSPETIRLRILAANLFSLYLLTEKKTENFREVKEADMVDFIEYCKKRSKRGLGKVGQNDYIAGVKCIYRILTAEEKILFNPFGDVGYIKNVRSIRDKILTEEEVTCLLDAIDTSKPVGIRDRCILELLYATGIRSAELFNLEIHDFIKDEKLLFIRQGKGRADRVLPLGETVSASLLHYIEKVRPILVRKKAIRYIFTKLNLRQLDRDVLKAVIKHAVKKAKIEKRINPHMLRHTFATHLLNNGADIREVQLLLGHASIKVTEVYLNLTSSHLKDMYIKHHPLENELYFDVYGRESYIFEKDFKTGVNLLTKKKLTEV